MISGARPAAVTLATLICCLPAAAQWPTDPALNLALADRTGDQVLPLLDATPDGGACVGWFDQAAGSFDVYLQRLDPAGFELWPHNGILVSDHP